VNHARDLLPPCRGRNLLRPCCGATYDPALRYSRHAALTGARKRNADHVTRGNGRRSIFITDIPAAFEGGSSSGQGAIGRSHFRSWPIASFRCAAGLGRLGVADME